MKIVADIGSTNLRVAIGQNEIFEKILRKTPNDPAKFISELCDAISYFIEKYGRVESIILSMAGVVDMGKGMLVSVPNLSNIRNLVIKEEIERKFGIPTLIINDCNAAVVGEKEFGCANRCRNVIYVTISTGIGGGIISNNELVLGKSGSAGEIGHMVIDASSKLKCSCGGYGHWEAFCGGNSIPRFVKYYIELTKNGPRELLSKDFDAKYFFKYAREKGGCSAIIEEICKYNSIGLANLANIFDPEIIVLGGRIIMNNADLLLEKIIENLEKYCLCKLPEVKLTKLGDDVGLYGCLAVLKYIKF